MVANYKSAFPRKGKHIFVPNDECAEKGHATIDFIESNVEFPDCFYHYRSGGHVAALHGHIERRYFFKIDLKNFYYSISRNRVARALHQIGCPKARVYAKWACVKNPYPAGSRYVLPIGFFQSPALASLVLMHSPIMNAISVAQTRGVFCSIYFDDFICSADDLTTLEETFNGILAACGEANLPINPDKLFAPAEEIIGFNCTLRAGFVEVRPERIEVFFEEARTSQSKLAFERYCAKVRQRNTATEWGSTRS
jgi:hypothetical protein